MTERLSVCFVWHMHQPLYKDRLSGEYLLPWVRLHAIKDYLDMPLLLKEYPSIKQTFNLVPSLLEQIDDYAWHGAYDEQLRLTEKPAGEYTQADKVFILKTSFHANFARQIKPHKPYLDLYNKRQRLIEKKGDVEEITGGFSDQQYADMATWLNLAWFAPLWYARNEELKSYLAAGKGFTQEKRLRLIEIERELMRQIIPAYRKLMESGQIEVTTSPYYHPILPLLIDTNSARLPTPQARLPERLYFHRRDARKQIESALSYYKHTFHQDCRGMWPSELALSPGALEIIAQCGVNWVVADEALLARTLETEFERDENGNLRNAEAICQPYRLKIGEEQVNVLFREVVLSNEVSFAYGHRSAEEAASALYMRLKHIQQRLFNWEREGIVVIALDGENCWETYEDDGLPFLTEVYKRLSHDNTLNVCTVSSYLGRNPGGEELHNIHSGSWIGADFHIWVGDAIKNRAWDLLSITRDFLVEKIAESEQASDLARRAWEEIYAAEGSDWFWWFGEPNNSADDPVFDQQFRLRLKNVYKIFGVPHPVHLDVPVADQVKNHETQIQKPEKQISTAR